MYICKVLRGTGSIFQMREFSLKKTNIKDATVPLLSNLENGRD